MIVSENDANLGHNSLSAVHQQIADAFTMLLFAVARCLNTVTCDS
jgi:hypothetical protein